MKWLSADSSSPQISAIVFGQITWRNASLRKSPQTFHQQLRRQISIKSWLAKFPGSRYSGIDKCVFNCDDSLKIQAAHRDKWHETTNIITLFKHNNTTSTYISTNNTATDMRSKRSWRLSHGCRRLAPDPRGEKMRATRFVYSYSELCLNILKVCA